MNLTPEIYLNPATKPFLFCPGCSHGNVLEALSKALVLTGLRPEQIVLATDIGCIGISDRHFHTHTFHGLHGRSVTYACGLKLARPELTVVVLVGDGGLGIGGHHFLHAARRNMDITVLVCNNFNFGMTGGQHSVTTPHDGITSTTSMGNVEYPLDIPGLVDVAKGNFAARAMFSDPDLPQLIADGIASPGFAAVEIWEMCTAYYAKRNRVTKQVMAQKFEEQGYRKGVLFSRDRPGYVEQVVAGLAARAKGGRSQPLQLEPTFPQPYQQRRTLLLAGRAGQKVRSSAVILGRAGALCDLYATQRDDYPVTVMTGHSVAEMIFQTSPINELGVELPETVILTAPEGKARILSRLARLGPESVVYAIPELLPVETGARVEVIPTEQLGLSRKRTGVVLGATAWVAAKTGLMPLEAIRASVNLESRLEIATENNETLDAVAALAVTA
jgi:2-oxoglutarate/2-oxoacid ferredoxin oxidoreductase subunit beta